MNWTTVYCRNTVRCINMKDSEPAEEMDRGNIPQRYLNCASENWIIIVTDKGLTHVQRQVIIWTNAGVLPNGPIETNFNCYLEFHNQNITYYGYVTFMTLWLLPSLTQIVAFPYSAPGHHLMQHWLPINWIECDYGLPGSVSRWNGTTQH